ncbi:MAG: hypothetical protein QF673_01395 [Candidatus Hydrothermarchaeota archaeon]|jgi:hypothetical protein|nr:hypothetical protein [Candidatus Hydrothermarchaeota archaeon]
MDELINLLIQKNEVSLFKKYDLDMDNVLVINNSLKDGKWRFLS